MKIKAPYKMGTGFKQWKDGAIQSITFVVTQDCNLRCKYCYMVNKNNENRMDFEVAKKAIDYFLDNPQLFEYDAVVVDFIGGEPFLEIDLIDKITDYFKLATYQKNHKWFDMHRFNFSTNGLLYSDPKVQKYVMKNPNKVSIGITIDGTKQKHDLQRVYPDGRGSYEDVLTQVKLCMEQLKLNNTKVTIGHDDLPYLKESIIHLWEIGLEEIAANVVFEDVWQEGDNDVFYEQLIGIADHIIENELWDKVNTTLFSDWIGKPISNMDLEKNRCGTGKMIAIDANGNFYPCVRYMDYSLENFDGYKTGDIYQGLCKDKLRPFYALNTKMQSDSECLSCEIAFDCAWCQGYNYDTSGIGTSYLRDKSICQMHKARVRANNYYWARLSNEKKIMRSGNARSGKNLYIITADDCISHCKYDTAGSRENLISEETLRRAAKFADENFFTPILLYSKHMEDQEHINEIFKYQNYISIKPAASNSEYRSNDIIWFDSGNISAKLCSDHYTAILSVEEKDMPNLSNMIATLLCKTRRININMRYDKFDIDLEKYSQQLDQILDTLYGYYVETESESKQINIITDRLMISQMGNCNAGARTYALGPNGKVYICPAFYFLHPDDFIGSLEEGVNTDFQSLFSLDRASICLKCDAYHCNRCVYINRKTTLEYNIPSSMQCKIAHIEREASRKFYHMLRNGNLLDRLESVNEIKEIDYNDPFELFVKI